MPLGSLVGEAYVRIHADTTFMKRAIERAAASDAEDYTRSFSKRIEAIADQEVVRGREALARAVAIQDFSKFEKQFGSVKGAVKGVDKELTELVSKNKIYADDVKVVENSLKKWAVKAQLREDMNKANLALARQVKLGEQMFRITERVNQAFDKQFKLGEQMARGAERVEVTRLKSSYEELSKTLGRGNEERKRTVNLLERNGIVLKTLASDLVRGENIFARFGKRTENVTGKFDKLGTSIGKAFGKGSRNNFFNFIGTFVGGITTLGLKVGTLVGPVSAVSKVFGDMIGNFQAKRLQGGGIFSSLASSAGIGLKAITSNLVILAAAFVGLITLLPLVASAFSMLAGSAVALAGAISLGLVGALLAVSPLAITAVAGLGALIVAMQQANVKGSESKKVLGEMKVAWQKALDPVRPKLDGIFKALSATFIPLTKQIVGPLLGGMAVALQHVIRNFGAILTAPATKGFINLWIRTMPGIFENLGKSLNNVLASIFSFFAPILGTSKDLSATILALTTRFLNWTQSANGQKSIHDFFTTAWRAAVSLYDIIVNVTKIIGDLFTVGTVEGGGQSFLTYLDTITKRFSDFLNTPQGQTATIDFFHQVKDFMIQGKDALEAMSTAFASLDTEKSRAALASVLTVTVDLINAFSNIVAWIDQNQIGLELLGGAMGNSAMGMQGVTDALGSMGLGMSQVAQAVLTLQIGFGTMALVALTGFQSILTAFLLFVGTFIQGALTAFGWIPGLGDQLRGAAGNVSRFSASANASINAIKKQIEIQVRTAAAALAVQQLAAQINSIKDKSVVITAIGRFANPGLLPNGGRGIGGGITNASGRLVTRPMLGIVGEAGPEAIVPLARPLSLVDPAVRALSAFAQSKPQFGSGGVVGAAGATVMPGAITVVTPFADPRLVAESVLDRVVAKL